jgi:DNA-binding ferritin-like protein
MEFKTLLSALILHSHNVRMLHWNVTGIDFDPVHKTLDNYYGMLDGFVDEIAEIGLQVGIEPVGLFEALATLKDDSRPYTNLLGSKKFTSTEAFTYIGVIFTTLIALYTNVCKDTSLPPDIINKLEEHMYLLRKELQYKNVSRLSNS